MNNKIEFLNFISDCFFSRKKETKRIIIKLKPGKNRITHPSIIYIYYILTKKRWLK